VRRVQDVMTKEVASCNRYTNLAAAVGIMWDNDCGFLPVADDDGKVIGIITDRDICIAVATRGKLASDIAVEEVMSREIFYCYDDDDVKDALKVMQSAKVHRLPVLLQGDSKLQGVLSLDDVALYAEEEREKLMPDISYKDVAVTLRAICEHFAQEKQEIELRIETPSAID
jgi:CBS domain-containing protein